MQTEFRICVEPDLTRTKRWAVVLRGPDSSILNVLSENMDRPTAERLLVPARRAFMAGVHWTREDVTCYQMSLNPQVLCVTGAKANT